MRYTSPSDSPTAACGALSRETSSSRARARSAAAHLRPARAWRRDGGDPLPERAAGSRCERASQRFAPRTHEARERAETLGSKRLELLAHVPRQHRRVTRGAHRDHDRGTIDDGGKDEARQLRIIHYVDRHAPLACGGGDRGVGRAIIGRGDDRDRVQELCGGKFRGDVRELPAGDPLPSSGCRCGATTVTCAPALRSHSALRSAT